ncbi:MAG: N-acetylmuramoyl-L-alanine amidase [Deltaproteobacteria bacterium]|nr:N-acetylmuramoyl-L-alanine amidase [Deltaproteobacteria bacterium]
MIAISRPSPYKLLELQASGREGPRVAIDVAGAEYEGPPSLPGDGLIERMRLAPRDGGTRIVLDLARAATPRAFYVPEPFRLVVDLSDEARPVEAPRGPRRVRRIVLDPGHGGHDPGAQGAGGLREKDVVLDVAHRAAPLLARELGVSALLTRDGDEFVPLEERVARANAFSADLFVSIHCNASENAASHGVMTFVLDSTRDDVALRVAARENAASPEAAAELATSLGRALDPGALARSAHFAGLLQRSALGSIAPRWPDVQDLGVRSAGFYVLAGARMPAALFEASFISHPVEARRLDTGDYRQKLADAIVNAVRAYREGL